MHMNMTECMNTYFSIAMLKYFKYRIFICYNKLSDFPLVNLYAHEYNVKYRTKVLKSNFIQQTR